MKAKLNIVTEINSLTSIQLKCVIKLELSDVTYKVNQEKNMKKYLKNKYPR